MEGWERSGTELAGISYEGPGCRDTVRKETMEVEKLYTQRYEVAPEHHQSQTCQLFLCPGRRQLQEYDQT